MANKVLGKFMLAKSPQGFGFLPSAKAKGKDGSASPSNENAGEPPQEQVKEIVGSAEEVVSKDDSSSTTTSTVPSQLSLNPEEIAEAENLAQTMGSFPVSNIKGAGSTQENRCNSAEINHVAEALRVTHGMAKTTALTGMGEMVRRGGANASTPETFKVTIKCPQEGIETDISKGELMTLVARHANGKNLRNLAEGMAGAIVRTGVAWAAQGASLPGDLAKKISNRLAYEKQPPLTPAEAVGCASYAQWLPDLDILVGSDRVKRLLAQDLEIRRSSRFQGKGDTTNQVQNQKGKGKTGGKGKGKGRGKGK